MNVRRLVLHAHWDAEARVRPFTLFHLQALRELPATVHLVSNSPLPEVEQAKLRPLCARVLLRENAGYDFGMWQAALAGLDLAAWDELVLTNSSVLGPLFPLGPIFERMAAGGADFWGMTESWQYLHHVQSWFLVLRAPVLSSPILRRFFEGVLPYREKKSVIHAYELGLTAALRDAGLRGAAAFPPESQPAAWLADLLVRRTLPWSYRRRKDPTIYYPDRLLRAGMPYVKRELLRAKPWRARALGLTRLVAGRPELATEG